MLSSHHAEKSAASAVKRSRKQGKGRKGLTKDMLLKGAGPELHLYWFIEAKDPENVTPLAQATATLAPVTSWPCHCTT